MRSQKYIKRIANQWQRIAGGQIFLKERLIENKQNSFKRQNDFLLRQRKLIFYRLVFIYN